MQSPGAHYVAVAWKVARDASETKKTVEFFIVKHATKN